MRTVSAPYVEQVMLDAQTRLDLLRDGLEHAKWLLARKKEEAKAAEELIVQHQADIAAYEAFMAGYCGGPDE